MEHISESSRKQESRRQREIKALGDLGLRPVIEPIESGSGAGWQEAECRLIASYRAAVDLWNATDGGEGGREGGWGTHEQRSAAIKRGRAHDVRTAQRSD